MSGSLQLKFIKINGRLEEAFAMLDGLESDLSSYKRNASYVQDMRTRSNQYKATFTSLNTQVKELQDQISFNSMSTASNSIHQRVTEDLLNFSSDDDDDESASFVQSTGVTRRGNSSSYR
jgi:hypothetical protein